MMAYDSQFVLAIMHSGSPVREINGKITLPFDSEYKIRLKNKHSYLRTKARVWVDGRKASGLGDFILKAGETLDLERFLDESMDSGHRFKFVPLSDKRVNDPTDSDNGIIKVEFYRETDYWNDWRIVVSPKPGPITPNIKSGSGGIGIHNGLNYVSKNTTTYTSTNDSMIGCSLNSSPTRISSPGQAGATVEGGFSGQQFVEGQNFDTDTRPVTLSLRIQGPRKQHPVVTGDSSKLGKVRFCSECGAKKMRGAKYCHRCGGKYLLVSHRG